MLFRSGGYARAQWMADSTGAIVVAVDAKGTPCRGRAWERAIEGDFGTLPVEGHVTALEAMARVLKEGGAGGRAVALALRASPHPGAKALLARHPVELPPGCDWAHLGASA